LNLDEIKNTQEEHCHDCEEDEEKKEKDKYFEDKVKPIIGGITIHSNRGESMMYKNPAQDKHMNIIELHR
jgi:hypothetical protein